MKHLTIAAAAALLLIATPAHAGIQNVQSALATETPEGLSGSVSGSLDWRTGNISFLSMAASGALRYRQGQHLVIGLVNLSRKSSGDALIIGRTFEHARYRYLYSPRLLFEGFAQHEYDAVKRLTIRAVAGLGPRYDLIDAESYGLGVGVAYMFEFEQLSEEEDPLITDSGDQDIAHRVSSYLVGRYEVNDRFQLVETFYVQPRLTDFNDTRLLSESSMVIKATDKLAVTTAFTIAYDNRPPQTVEKTDSALITTLSYSWGDDG